MRTHWNLVMGLILLVALVLCCVIFVLVHYALGY